MNFYRHLLCVMLCISMILSLAGCGQSDTTPTQATVAPTEKTQVAVDSCLATAQGFIDKEDFDSAIAVLEDARAIADDERIAAMLEQIDDMQGTALEVEMFANAEHLQTGSVEIHSVSAQERTDGAVRYTIAYSAPSGMYIHLVEGRLDHHFDFETTGQRDKVTFEISSQDVRNLNGTFGIKIAFDEENYYFLKLNTVWPEEETSNAVLLEADEIPEECELSFWHQNELRGCTGTIESFTVKDVGDSWKFTISHTLPENLDVTVYLWSDRTREVFLEKSAVTNGTQQVFQFEILKEELSQWKSINVSFGSEEAGNYGADVHLPFQIQKTFGTPIGEPVQTGYYIEDKLKSSGYEIHNITVQRLNNGYVRYTLDMTLSDNMRLMAFLNTDLHNPSGNQFISDFYSNGERKQYLLDIHEEHLAKSNYLFMSGIVDEKNQNGFIVWIPHSYITASTDGTPLPLTIPLSHYVWNNPDEMHYQFHECTAQILNNGYVRYTLTCTLPQGILCRFMDPPDGNNVSAFFATGSDAEKHTFVVDVKEEIAYTTNQFTFFLNLFGGQDGATITIDNSPVADPDLLASIPPISVKVISPEATE